MSDQLLINRDPFASQGIYGSFYIYRIPQGDRRSQQRQTTGTVALILQSSISDLTQPVHKDRSCKRIAGLTFIQPCLYASAQ